LLAALPAREARMNRSRPRRRHARRTARTHATLDHLPLGLSAEDRDWLLTRAHLVGGLTQAFVHLVRLNILADALLDASARVQSLETELLGQGLPHSLARRHANEFLDQRLAVSMTRRFVHAAAWTRPARDRDRCLYVDPADPLPHVFTRRLIREGRDTFDLMHRFVRATQRCR
jgi:hypothetical protein